MTPTFRRASATRALVASFGALITVLGFALPWLVPVAIVWGVIALVRRRRRRRTPSETEA